MSKGASGKVDFPQFLKDAQQLTLAGSSSGYDAAITAFESGGYDPNMLEELAAAYAAGNPFSGEEAYDPDTDLGSIETQFTAFKAFLAALNEETTWAALVNQAVSTVDGSVLTSTGIDDLVDTFETSSETSYLRELGNFTQQCALANQVDSSAFLIGLALHGERRQLRIDGYRAEQMRQDRLLRSQLIMQGASQMFGILQLETDMNIKAVMQQIEISRGKIVAKNDQMQTTLEYDIRAARYYLDLINTANQALGALTGTQFNDVKTPNKLGQALSSGIGGAAMGAMMGGMIAPAAEGAAWGSGGGPIGMGIGAAMGIGLSFLN